MTSTSSGGNLRHRLAVRPEPRHRHRRGRGPIRHQRLAEAPALEPARRRRSTARPIPPTRPSSHSRITSKIHPLSQVEDLVDTRLAPKISQLNGVGLVSISGGQKPAVRIQANPTALSSYGINLEDLRTALDAGQRERRQGQLRRPARRLPDRRQRSARHQQRLPQSRRRLPQRRARDADAMSPKSSTASRTASQAAWMNETPAVILNIQRQPGANTISVVRSIKTMLPSSKSTSRLHPCHYAHRPHHRHRSLRRRRRVRADAHHRARRHGHLPLPAQPLRDHHPQRRRARSRWSAPSA